MYKIRPSRLKSSTLITVATRHCYAGGSSDADPSGVNSRHRDESKGHRGNMQGEGEGEEDAGKERGIRGCAGQLLYLPQPPFISRLSKMLAIHAEGSPVASAVL